MSRRVVREAKAAAARRGATLAEIVGEALTRTLGAGGREDDDAPLAADMAWYARHRSRLARRYQGEYVAIVDGRVVDHDVDFGALAGRVFRATGERPVFMPKVGEESVTLRIRSPRLVP
jgi:hypothetical protein